jgi:putative phosphoribosyl transferase
VDVVEFRDRREAGRIVAQALTHLQTDDVVVLGLAGGGVPVAAEVAWALGAPRDVVVVRKVAVPWQPELAMGVVGEDGTGLVNPEVVRLAGVEADELAEAQERSRAEVDLRVARLHADQPPVALAGRTAVLVDDGMATGATARVACRVARKRGARRVVVAVPVASAQALAAVAQVADEVVCPVRPGWFPTVGQWYGGFGPIGDEDILALLRGVRPTGVAGPPRTGVDREVVLWAAGVQLGARLTVPPDAHGLVVFAHSSGSSRHSPRNRYVAGLLNRAGLGTVLLDLLTAEEEAEGRHVFDIDVLGARLVDAVAVRLEQSATASLPVGIFGAGTGAAAALWAATELRSSIAAVVSRDGRPDLAGSRLRQVHAPTLLIVGRQDRAVAELNRAAQARMHCTTQLADVPGVTLSAEPDVLAPLAGLARDWFTTYLVAPNVDEARPRPHVGAL